jgi:uncharacterized membrane protein (UPF0136 family)
MKTLRILAIIPLTLMSLMNVGYILPTDPKHNTVVAIGVLALGVVGLGAAYGLARNTSWGVPAAVTVAAVNVAAAIIALVNDAEGATIGLVVSTLALLLSFAAGARRHTATTAAV